MSRIERLAWIVIASLCLTGTFHTSMFLLKNIQIAAKMQGRMEGDMHGYRRGYTEAKKECPHRS